MKHFTSLAVLGMLAAGVSANAQATFQLDPTNFGSTHRTDPCIADFTNNGRMDIFWGGQGNDNLKLVDGDQTLVDWWWQIMSNLAIQQEDGTFVIDGQTYAPRTEIDEETGEEKTVYDRVWPNHGVRGATFNQYGVIDYNNDGLVDLLLFGRHEWDVFDYGSPEDGDGFLLLYKNLGNGKFELVPEAVFPSMRPDNEKNCYAISVGDYDRDGFVDFIVSATEVKGLEDGMPGRNVGLYRNMGGTGVFEEQKIAETKGGVWVNAVMDGDTEIVPARELKGWFLPVSGNVHFADINNDGWLDIVCDGWADKMWDGIHNDGNNARVYLNQNGQKFVDVTSDAPTFYTLRSSGSNVFDFDGDGYLDFFMTGWGDNGVNWNAYLFYNDPSSECAYELPESCDNLGLDGTEKCRQIIRDFDGDGVADIYYNANGGYIYYGNTMGTFTKGEESPCGNYDGAAAAGDINGNGLSDIFAAGYGQSVKLALNQSEAPEAPAAPENVEATVADGVLTITWDYDEDAANEARLAYNLFVKKADGSVYCLIPADPATGFVKSANERTVALRPSVKSYSIPVDGEGYTVGVQAISTMNETYSPFATATTSGIEGVAEEAAAPAVKVLGNTILVEGEGAVAVYDVTGKQIAAGVAGTPIEVAANGVLVVKTAGKAVKVIK